MATTNRKSLGDAPSTPAVPFSYAQAAKGISSSGPSAVPSKAPSSSTLPSKDTGASSSSVEASAGAASSQSTTVEREGVKEKDNHDAVSANTDSQANTAGKQPRDSTSLPNDTENLPSPEFGMSSTSTLPREDDVCSLKNGSSESTWEVISQTSNNAEKPSEDNEQKPGKDKGKKKSTSKEKEKPAPKLLQEAPIPPVNVWKQRAEEAKAKAALQPALAKELSTATTSGTPVRSTINAGTSTKSDGRIRSNEASSRPKESHRGGPADNRTSDKSRERRNDDNTRRGRRMSVGASGEDKPHPGSMSAPLPSMGDSESWPTPLNAKGEDRRRVQEKSEKDKTVKDNGAAPAAPKGKAGWISVPIEPTVVFKTPLPNTNPRRGGRAGRGRDGGNRGSSNGQRGSLSGEKNESNESTAGDAKRNGRQRTSRSTSPPKNQRGASNDRGSRRESRVSNFTTPSKETAEPSNPLSQRPTPREWSNSQNQNAQAGASLRNTTLSKPRQSRSADSAPNAANARDTEAGATAFQPAASALKEEPVQTKRISSVAADREDQESGKEFVGRASKDMEALNPSVSKFNPPTERRNGPFSSSHNPRDRFERGRGNGRGRNGGHGFHHQGVGQVYTSATVSGASQYGLPRSPTTFQQENYFGQQQQSQPGRHYRNPGRAQSIAGEPFYGRVNSGYNAPPLAPIQTYMGASHQMYDYGMFPMSAAPYPPYVDPFGLTSMIRTQLEYYFSIDNLIKDVYLRSHMDSQGFVLLSFITQFNRLKQLTTDVELIKLAIQHSNELEYWVGSDGKERIRKREDWQKWVLAMEERDESARNDGPPLPLSYPPEPRPTVLDGSIAAIRYPISTPLSPTAVPGLGEIPPLANGLGGYDMAEAGAYPGLQTSPTSMSFAGDMMHSPEPIFSPHSELPMNGTVESEPDDFADHRMTGIFILGRDMLPSLDVDSNKPESSVAGRQKLQTEQTDRQSRADKFGKAVGSQSTQESNGYVSKGRKRRLHRALTKNRRRVTEQGSPEPTEPFPALSPDGSLPGGVMASTTSSAAPSTRYWVRDRDSPSTDIPPDAKGAPYSQYVQSARSERAPGHCPHSMKVLYAFWSHFLVRNFNTHMYNEFRKLAHEDLENGIDLGKGHLLILYTSALKRKEQPIRSRLARHFVQLAKDENDQAERPATNQLRTAWRDETLNPSSRMKLQEYFDSELVATLDG